jgi:hypothetical protein
MSMRSITSCLGYQQITSLATAVGLTVPTLSPEGLQCSPSVAVIIPTGAGIRWRDDGIAPTASVGMPVTENGVLEYDGDLSKIRFIQQSGMPCSTWCTTHEYNEQRCNSNP